MAKKEFSCEEATDCKATRQMLEKAGRDGVDTAFHRAHQMAACPIGAVSACCRLCAMGPCRLNPKDPTGKVGVCGATYDTIASRNFARMVAAGTASHTDHGMALLDLFREVAHGHNTAYQIKDVNKLRKVAESVGIEVEVKDNGSRSFRDTNEIARELADKLQKSFTQVEGEIPFASRVPEKTLEVWRKEGIVPRGAMLEIMELMHRTHMGMDQDYENIMTQTMRCALADGWAGSMVGTEIADILYGTPEAVRTEVDMGCLAENKVNIIVHGHEPTLFESIIDAVNDDKNIAKAKAAGAEGINLLGMCCSGAEALMRHGIPHAGSFMSTEAVMVTGAVDAMAADIQCIMQGLSKVAECYNTRFFTTNRRARIEGAEHIELDENNPTECCNRIVEMAIERFKNRNIPIEIPEEKHVAISGFNHEYINYMLGGRFRESYKPLNDNIINGRIRGVVGVVGCTNPRVKMDSVHVPLVKELVKNDILVLMTGCAAISLAKEGLLTPESARDQCGPGLAEVCETVGMPPVLNLGSCVDNSRILIACSELVKVGGLGDKISDLPVAGIAPEWMSEKAIAIGQYFVASGAYIVFGVTFPVVQDTKFAELLFNGLADRVGGKWAFIKDPHEIAQSVIAHIEAKREALGINKKKERKLFDMEDRRQLATD